MTGKAHQTCTCDHVTYDRKGAPDLYLWLRDVWQEWCTRLVPVITWRVTGMTHQICTCDYVTCDRNDAPDSYLWLRDVWQEWRTRLVPVITWRVLHPRKLPPSCSIARQQQRQSVKIFHWMHFIFPGNMIVPFLVCGTSLYGLYSLVPSLTRDLEKPAVAERC